MRQAHWSTWYQGTEREWQSLPMTEREHLAFEATGCAIAYPTWEAPVDCVHTGCQVLRGELPKIALVNTVLRAERNNGWLRDCSRDYCAKLFRHVRGEARRTGVYDAWELAWAPIVYGGVMNA